MLGPLLEVEMSKKCTPLWREAHFEVKMYKTHQLSDHSWKLRCRKSVRRCGAKHISKSKCTKHTHCRTTFGSWDVEKVYAVVARSTFRGSKCTKHYHVRDHFWRFKCCFAWQAQGIVHLVKSEQEGQFFSDSTTAQCQVAVPISFGLLSR